MIGRILGPLVFTFVMLTQAAAVSPEEQRGKTFALNNCARCHAIDKVSASPLKIAPPFRTLHLRYPIETIAEALAEGIYTGHPTMPAFQLDPDQILRSAVIPEDARVAGLSSAAATAPPPPMRSCPLQSGRMRC